MLLGFKFDYFFDGSGGWTLSFLNGLNRLMDYMIGAHVRLLNLFLETALGVSHLWIINELLLFPLVGRKSSLLLLELSFALGPHQ